MKELSNYINIKNDVFNINKRILKFNKDYIIKYNIDDKKYYIFDKIKQSIVLSLPYENLDERALNYVAKRNSQSNDEIILEIEKHNNENMASINRKIIDSAMSCAEKTLRRSTLWPL